MTERQVWLRRQRAEERRQASLTATRVECPYCRALVGEVCVTIHKREATFPHMQRVHARYRQVLQEPAFDVTGEYAAHLRKHAALLQASASELDAIAARAEIHRRFADEGM